MGILDWYNLTHFYLPTSCKWPYMPLRLQPVSIVVPIVFGGIVDWTSNSTLSYTGWFFVGIIAHFTFDHAKHRNYWLLYVSTLLLEYVHDLSVTDY